MTNWYTQKIDIPDATQPLETIFEVVTAANKEGFGYAVAHITRAAAHYHKYTDETYTLLGGKLRVHIGKKSFDLTTLGASLEIPIGETHWAESLEDTPAKVGVHTIPAWSQEDHILV